MPRLLRSFLAIALLTACQEAPETVPPASDEFVRKDGPVVEASEHRVSGLADTVYHTGKIYTVNGEQPWAQALAIRDGEIIFVGADDGARKHIGAETVVHDLRGRLMMPAFQDAHIHPIGSGMDALTCDLHGLDDIALYRSRISEYARANPDVPWILGGGWSMAVFGPGASPSREILDELVTDRPVFSCSLAT